MPLFSLGIGVLNIIGLLVSKSIIAQGLILVGNGLVTSQIFTGCVGVRVVGLKN
ncbi:hypothetical protein [Candidatus Tisiphia endosymbiont of Ptychoptera albimana]|uniref:hypothetical protein n=1 Tax=Candidatus Tisiphia endosymbiont of Ptychoptera albimana TaxID=3066260 RepID=UPI00312C6D35